MVENGEWQGENRRQARRRAEDTICPMSLNDCPRHSGSAPGEEDSMGGEPLFMKFFLSVLTLIVGLLFAMGGYFVNSYERRLNVLEASVITHSSQHTGISSELSYLRAELSRVQGNLNAIGEFVPRKGNLR